MSNPAPTAVSRATAVALGVRVVLLAVTTVSVHDLAVDRGWASGSPWVTSVLDAVDGIRPGVGTDVLAVLLVLVALWLLLAALRPARRTHDRVRTDTDVDLWISRRTVARIAEEAARWSPGVEDATARVRRRKVGVEVVALDDASRDRAQAEIERALAGYTERPVTVTRKKDDDD